MKTGILSMQRIKNSGSFLQAYGLKKILEQLGNEVCFVDFPEEAAYRESLKPKKLTLPLHLAKKIVKKIYMNIFHKKKALAMAAMERQVAMYTDTLYAQLGMTAECNFHPDIDALVIGSDEIFNSVQYCKLGFPCPMCLYGKGYDVKKLYSYAASFGGTTVEGLEKYGAAEEAAQLLKKFDKISVRDDSSAAVIKQLTGITPDIHLDPVLIHDFSEVEIKKPPIDNYIIVYAYFNRITEDEIVQIKAFAQKHKKKLICVNNVQFFCDEFIDCHPLELLSYFKYADYVVTDTFHGAVLSMKYKKNFAVYVRDANKEKLGHLVHRFKMDSKIATADKQLEDILCSDADYSFFNSELELERKKTLEYLSEIGR